MNDARLDTLLDALGGGITLQEDGAYLSEDAGLLIREFVAAEILAPSRIERGTVLDEITQRYERTPEDGEHDYFREALNDAYNAGLVAAQANEAAAESEDSSELVTYLRRAINAAVFGIPAEAIAEVQAKLSSLERRLERSAELGALDQHYADIVRTAMAFDEGGDYGALTSACARLRLARAPRGEKKI